jgi:hypothetical protein
MFCFSVEGSSPWWTELVRKGAPCCHGDHDDYACFGGRAPTLGLEGLEFDIREPSCKECVGPWLHHIMPGLKQRCSPETQWLRCLPGTEGPPGREVGSAWLGGGILFILQSQRKAQYHSFLSLVLFRWVAPPL